MMATDTVHDDHDNSVETHYSGLERLRPHDCVDGYLFRGRIHLDETGEEIEVYDLVPCRRCRAV